MSRKHDRKRGGPDAFLVLLICVLGVPGCAVLTGALEAAPLNDTQAALAYYGPWLTVGAALGILHILARPVLRVLTAPIGCLTLGLSGFVIDVVLLYFAARCVEGFAFTSLVQPIVTAAFINALCAITGAR